jgi:hypothetical protein
MNQKNNGLKFKTNAMKNLKLLSATLFLICSAFGTSATAQEKEAYRPLSKVVLDSVQSIRGMIDLIEGDAAKAENIVLRNQLDFAKEKDAERVKDSLVQENQKAQLRLAVKAKEEEVAAWKNISSINEQLAAQRKREALFWKIAVPVTAVCTYLIVKE